MNEFIKRSQALTEAMNKFAVGYGEDSLEAFVLANLRGRKRVNKALKNIKVEE